MSFYLKFIYCFVKNFSNFKILVMVGLGLKKSLIFVFIVILYIFIIYGEICYVFNLYISKLEIF